MKKYMFISVILLLLATTTLSGCGTSKKTDTSAVKTSRVTKKTVGALTAEKSNIINLDGRKLDIDTRYRVAKIEDDKTEITSYFIFNNDKVNQIADERDGRSGTDYYEALKSAWDEAQRLSAEQASKFHLFGKKEEASTEPQPFVFDETAYITAYHEDIIMYVYSGLDRATPATDLKDYEIKSSIQSYVNSSLGANVELRNAMYDTHSVPQIAEDTLNPIVNDKKLNGDFYVMTFTANSGDKAQTTYGATVNAKQYYGIYFMEKEVEQGSLRKWYGIVFTNDSVGDIIEEDFYKDIFSQLKTRFNITQYYTDWLDTSIWSYKKETDYRNGKSYNQLLTTFNDTMNFYVLKGNKKQNEAITETEITTEEPTEESETQEIEIQN